MGFRQEHGKVLKLQVVQSLYGYLPYDERIEHEESFEAACRQVMGQGWDDSGLSMESAEGLCHYLRGVQSASGKPLRINNTNLMLGLTNRVLSLESRMAAYEPSSLASALMQTSFESEAGTLLKQYGLEALSTEGLALSAVKFVGSVLKGFFKGNAAKATKAAEKAFDPKNLDWSQVAKMADYIASTGATVKKIDYVPVEEKVSGEGIVKNLTWGHEFDEKDPVGFIKKKFAKWEKFYHTHEQAVARFSAVIKADEKTTRPAIKAVDVEDNDKMEEIIQKAVAAIRKAETPTAALAKIGGDFPGARKFVVDKRGERGMGYDIADVVDDKAFKDIGQLRPLKKEEAIALIEWLYWTIKDMKKYTTIYDKAKWSDHSDGDVFWDQIEQCASDEYGVLIYWQTCDADFIDNVDDISEILARLNNGIMTWIDRSFHNHRAED